MSTENCAMQPKMKPGNVNGWNGLNQKTVACAYFLFNFFCFIVFLFFCVNYLNIISGDQLYLLQIQLKDGFTALLLYAKSLHFKVKVCARC